MIMNGQLKTAHLNSWELPGVLLYFPVKISSDWLRIQVGTDFLTLDLETQIWGEK